MVLSIPILNPLTHGFSFLIGLLSALQFHRKGLIAIYSLHWKCFLALDGKSDGVAAGTPKH
jgi:hypothetical protein